MSIADGVIAWRTAAALLVLSVLLLWETVQPYFPLFGRGPTAGRKRLWHATRNLGLGLVNGLVVRFGFLGVWIATMAWSGAQPFGLLHWITVPEWMRWTLAILLLDLWTYAWHRLNHTVPVLWRFHRLHHTDRQMDVTTANRFHIGEIVLSSVVRVPLLALLGCGVEQLAVYEMILFAVVQFQHANVGLPDTLDRMIRAALVTPHLHKVHHSVVVAEQNANFSSLFSWWDRLARTFRVAPDLSAIVFGVEEPGTPRA